MVSKARSRQRIRTWASTRRRRLRLLALIPLVALAWPTYEALAAQPPVGLGTAGSFAVLGGSAVTNTGPSTINGNLGVDPGTSITGFPPGTVNGATHSADAVALQAKTDLTTAYNDAAGRIPAATVSGDLGGSTLTPGVYKSASSLGLTGTLTLNAQGNPAAVFIFQAGSTLTTASASDVSLINGARACNVYWQIGSSATLGTASTFVGNILAYTSISLNNDVTVSGRALARNGAVTMIDDTITPTACAANTDTTTGTSGTGTGTGTGTGKGTGKGTTKPAHTPGATKVRNGTAALAATSHPIAAMIARYGTSRCIGKPVRVAVTGRAIRRVVFSLGPKVIASPRSAPFATTVAAIGGVRVITARVTYKNATRAKTRQIRYRACAAAVIKTMAPAKPITAVGVTG
jgi:hypothetical protein